MEIMEWEKAKELVDRDGWDGFMEQQNDGRELYAVSQWWYDDPKYICKFRGKYGDKIIGWKGVHDNDA